MRRNSCTKGHNDYSPSGACRVCQREYDQRRNHREATRSIGASALSPAPGWRCPLCLTSSSRWICSSACTAIIAEATIAGVDYRAYRKDCHE